MPHKVGIWAWDDLCWFSFFSRLGGWRKVIFQVSIASTVSSEEQDPDTFLFAAWELRCDPQVGDLATEGPVRVPVWN